MRSVSISSLFPANVKYEKKELKEVFLWHVEIPTKWKVYKSFSRSKHRPPCWKCSVYVTLTQTVWISLESPLYGLTRSLEQYFFALCDFAWQSDVTLRLLIVQKCNNKKTWVFVFFRICFYLSMCKITFFSCFVVISNVFTSQFINDSVSLRIEPLTVRNCSPWRWHKTLSASAISKQVSRRCINFPHELTCQILTNQNIKIGRRAWSTRDS